ncbi:hypothetical protein PHLGIDRAFT_192146 [Phlebiopsis gigantea 11061_1 CR5-6]|uniref:Uncharacterized protein n=1 Tax=Phlebiopsis gigantea (strain 11061_1 CR5-6) TaxID=745531 RepID=A0A0C3S3M3_PHLG1|nr:hypothetical protein PHLGIDRAFT_192146 [Phlebiopsis gigantea 11061_1 CR5-6]
MGGPRSWYSIYICVARATSAFRLPSTLPQLTPMSHLAPQIWQINRRHLSLPAELLHDILAPVIMETIDKLVYASREEYCALWLANITALLITSKQFNCIATRILCDALEIAQDGTGRSREGPAEVLWRMRADTDLFESQINTWERAANLGRLVAPKLYEGRPLERLYRLSEYGPWYFRVRALLCTTVEELLDLRQSMLGELEEMVARLRFPGLGEYIRRRLVRVESCYSNGCEMMRCGVQLRFMQDSLLQPTSALISRLKDQVPRLAQRLALSTQQIDTAQPVDMSLAQHALTSLVNTLHAMNEPDTDHSVKYFFCGEQSSAIEELWYELVDTLTSHAQRRRLASLRLD